jgi:hypothetical protein
MGAYKKVEFGIVFVDGSAAVSEHLMMTMSAETSDAPVI